MDAMELSNSKGGGGVRKAAEWRRQRAGLPGFWQSVGVRRNAIEDMVNIIATLS